MLSKGDKDIMDFLNIIIQGNHQIFLLVILLLVSSILTWIIDKLINLIYRHVSELAKNTSSPWDDMFIDLLRHIKKSVIFVLLIILLGSAYLDFDYTKGFLKFIFVAALSYQWTYLGHSLIRALRKHYLNQIQINDMAKLAAYGIIFTSVEILFFILTGLIILGEMGVDVAALITGLGIGGLAVALAAQNILGDLFASVSIILDKPFAVGDTISVNSILGSVEKIGLKSTWIRSLGGEQIIVSNKQLLENFIQNYNRMQKRRLVQRLGVIYSTPIEKLEAIPLWIQNIVQSYPLAAYDRCHFFNYGAYSLDFEWVAWIATSDYNIYMDQQQKILLDIFKKFKAEGVEFAYPTYLITSDSKITS